MPRANRVAIDASPAPSDPSATGAAAATTPGGSARRRRPKKEKKETGMPPLATNGPGPQAYMLPASVGEQVNSRYSTQARVVFPQSPRVPKSHAAGMSDAPGPGSYKVPPSVGPSVLSRVRSAPVFTIKGREKFGSTTVELGDKKNEPGPGAYKPRMVNPNERRAPAHKLGTRTANERRQPQTPGPATYEKPRMMGRQLESARQSAPTVRFAMSTRDRRSLRAAEEGAGPGEYKLPPSVGRQLESNRKSIPSPAFGNARRKDQKFDSGPGPGSYRVYDSFGTSSFSTFRTAPACTMSGREKFGTHYG